MQSFSFSFSFFFAASKLDDENIINVKIIIILNKNVAFLNFIAPG
tara:strand:- start:382 stop:516 length:135 start_codon:yes stop_codon:yes gene_type:complete